MKKFILLSGLSLLISIATMASDTAHKVYDGKHEWRAVWIATVDNIDWPSSRGLSTERQKQELIEYLDLFKKMNFNSIVLQIRPTADAFYMSAHEPWSIYLTGDQKKTPDPLYDPLAFAITEAHKRGMELHAWLNPYRVLQSTGDIPKMSPQHLYHQRPELFVRHGKKLYFDPAYPETREYLVKVIKDIVTRYDVDGIHFDDYFYPNNDFDDTRSFALHPRGYAQKDKMAWRRENVDMVIEMLRDSIKHIKPYVKFGISPYAVWRNLRDDPRGSATKSYAYTNYDNLHADILLWMEKGWLDYILPQLYFNIGYENADFKILADWWQDYSAGTPVYGGLGTYRLGANAKPVAWQSADEIKKQTMMLRNMEAYQGACYFNAKNFKENRLGINKIMEQLYPNPALVPPLRGFPVDAPDSPTNVALNTSGNDWKITWNNSMEQNNIHSAKYHVVYRFAKNEVPDFTKGTSIIALTGERYYQLKNTDKGNYDYYVSALDRLYNESEAVKVK